MLTGTPRIMYNDCNNNNHMLYAGILFLTGIFIIVLSNGIVFCTTRCYYKERAPAVEQGPTQVVL